MSMLDSEREAIHRRSAELNLITKAIADHNGCAPEWCGGSSLDPCALANAIERLEQRHGGRTQLLASIDQENACLVERLDALRAQEERPAACPKCGGPCEDECQFIEPEEPPGWVPRTWVDVRRGDRVRLPGTEHVAEVAAAVHMPWHVHPASRRDPLAMEWAAVRVTLNGRQYDKKPADPIEIELSPGEVAAIELLGWDNREGLLTSE